MEKAGSRIREHVLSITQNSRGNTRENVGKFYWQKGTVKNRQTQVRFSNRDNEMKNVRYICKEELRAIDNALGLNGNEEALAKKLGLKRLRVPTRLRLKSVLAD